MNVKEVSAGDSETRSTESETAPEKADSLISGTSDAGSSALAAKLEKKQAAKAEKQAEKAERYQAKTARFEAKVETKESGRAQQKLAKAEQKTLKKIEERKAERQAWLEGGAANPSGGAFEVPTLSYKDAQSIPQNCHRDPIFAVRNPDSNQLLLIFTGLGGKVGVTLDVAYAHLPDPKPNVLFISQGSTGKILPPYMEGIPGLGADRASSIAEIARLSKEWGVNQMSAMGTSVGTFGAVMFGVSLRAQTILAFGPVTSFRPGFDDRVDSFTARGGFDPGKYTEEDFDMKVYYTRHNQGSDVRIFYATEHENDRKQAENFRGAKGVTLIPVANPRHSILKVLAKNGTLRTEFEKIFAGGKAVAALVGYALFFLFERTAAISPWVAEVADLAA